MSWTEAETVVKHISYGLFGLGFVVFGVVMVMQKMGLIGNKDKVPTGRNINYPAFMANPGTGSNPGCVSTEELWREHLPRFKDDHDELCAQKLKGIEDQLEDVSDMVKKVPKMEGKLDTILDILKKNGGMRRN